MTSSVCSSLSVRMSTETTFLRKSCGARSASVFIIITSGVPKSWIQLAAERQPMRKRSGPRIRLASGGGRMWAMTRCSQLKAVTTPPELWSITMGLPCWMFCRRRL